MYSSHLLSPFLFKAVLAAATGTGKTLAYLLPLLCTSPGGQKGEGAGGVLVVTPTIELAVQIRREVDVLWPPEEEDNGGGRVPSLFVIGDNTASGDNKATPAEDDEAAEDLSPGRIALGSLARAPLIAGTPKMLRSLYREAARVADEDGSPSQSFTDEERAAALALRSNLRAVVLDEADRLLRTEATAREVAALKARREAERRGDVLPKRKVMAAKPTQAELLLRDLPVPSLADIQIVCASATIGRTLRRQLMGILDAPSADVAATLVTGEGDARAGSKKRELRRSALLPAKLAHAYRVVPEEGEEGGDAGGTKTTSDAERRASRTLATLWDTLTSLEIPAPTLVFPGRVGVESAEQYLRDRGLEDVRTLRNLDGRMRQPAVTPFDVSEAAAPWRSVPVYVIGERFARGLDLSDVDLVVLLSPPSSAAGYAHMAGRTARSGQAGVAITLVQPRIGEVRRLAAIAAALGLQFDAAAGESGAGGSEPPLQQQDGDAAQGESVAASKQPSHGCTPEPDATEEGEDTWRLLSESALRQKKNAELYAYLVSCGVKIAKRSTKAELVAAIQSSR